MLFRSVLSLAVLICSSSAAPIEKRQRGQDDFQIVAGVLNGITQGIKRTQSDIKAWRGDQKGANLVLDDSEYLYRDILQGTQVVGRTRPISAWDTTTMMVPGNTLNAALESLLDDLIRKKRQVEKLNYTPIVRSQLLKIRDSTDGLIKALFTKLPPAASLVARPVSNLVTSRIERAIKEFPLPTSGGGSWWPSQGAQPAPTVTGPSPYRNDPLPQPVAQSQPPSSQAGPSWGSPSPQQQAGPAWGNAPGNAPPQQNGAGAPPAGSGWGRNRL